MRWAPGPGRGARALGNRPACSHGPARPEAPVGVPEPSAAGCRVAPDAGGEGVSVCCASTLPSRSLGGSGTGVLLCGLEAPGLPGSFWDGSAEMPPACCGLPAGSAQVGRALCQSPAVLTRVNLKTVLLPRWGPVPVSGDQPPPQPLAPTGPLPVRGRVTHVDSPPAWPVSGSLPVSRGPGVCPCSRSRPGTLLCVGDRVCSCFPIPVCISAVVISRPHRVLLL